MDDEVIWATSTLGANIQCVHVSAWQEAKWRIAELEAALRRCNDVATAEGNDPRNAPDTRSGFRSMGAVIRKEMAAMGLE